jgi:hypothetical protein
LFFERFGDLSAITRLGFLDRIASLTVDLVNRLAMGLVIYDVLVGKSKPGAGDIGSIYDIAFSRRTMAAWG